MQPSLAPPSPGLATSVSAGPAAIECWFVEDAGGGRLAKKPAALLLRQGPGTVPARPDLDPKFYLKVHGESSRTPLSPNTHKHFAAQGLLCLGHIVT